MEAVPTVPTAEILVGTDDEARQSFKKQAITPCIATVPTVPTNFDNSPGILRTEPGRPAPRIVCDPDFNFGCDRVPARYTCAWDDLLSQCPPSVRVIDWEIAIFSAAALFGDWGGELVRLGWPADAIFALPCDGEAGLAWYLGGQHVVFLGPARAFLGVGLIFDRKQMTMQLLPPRAKRRGR